MAELDKLIQRFEVDVGELRSGLRRAEMLVDRHVHSMRSSFGRMAAVASSSSAAINSSLASGIRIGKPLKAETTQFIRGMSGMQAAAVGTAAGMSTAFAEAGSTIRGMESAAKIAKGNVSDLGKTGAKAAEGLNKSLGTAARTTMNVGKTMSTSLAETGSVIRGAESAAKIFGSRMTDVAGTMGNAVPKAANDAAKHTLRYGQAANDARGAGTRLQRTLRSMGGGFGRFRSGVAGATRAVFSLRGALVGAGIGVLLHQIMDSFAQFEQRLIEVGKVANLEGKELEQLGGRVERLATRVPIATNQLLEITGAAARLGVRGQDNLLAFTEAVGKMGLATDLAGEQAASALAIIMNLTDTPSQEVSNLGSAIVEMGNNFATTESKIANMANRVAQAGAQFDMSSDQAVGLSAAMLDMGIRAEMGGTQISLALQGINKAARQGGDELAAFQKVVNRTQESMLQMVKTGGTTELLFEFIRGLARIKEAGGDIAPILDDIGLSGSRAQIVFGALASDVETVNDALAGSAKAYRDNVALNEEALRASKSFSAQMQLVGNAVNRAMRIIGQELAPVIIKNTRHFRDWINEAAKTGKIEQWGHAAARGLKTALDVIQGVVSAMKSIPWRELESFAKLWFGGIGQPSATKKTLGEFLAEEDERLRKSTTTMERGLLRLKQALADVRKQIDQEETALFTRGRSKRGGARGSTERLRSLRQQEQFILGAITRLSSAMQDSERMWQEYADSIDISLFPDVDKLLKEAKKLENQLLTSVPKAQEGAAKEAEQVSLAVLRAQADKIATVAELEARLIEDNADRRIKALEGAFNRNEASARQFFETENELQRRAIRARIDAINTHMEQQNRVIAAMKDEGAEKSSIISQETQLEHLMAERKILQRDLADLTNKEAKAALEAKINFERINRLRERASVIQQNLNTQEERIERQREAGALTQIQAQQKLITVRRRAIQQLEAMARQMRDVAETTGNRQMLANVAQFEEQIEQLKTSIEELGTQTSRDLAQAISESFGKMITEGESLLDVLKNIERQIMNIVTRRLFVEPFADFLTGAIKGSGILGAIGLGGGGAIPNPAGLNQFGQPLAFRQFGGPVFPRQPTLVGERGPEIFVPRSSGSVMNNRQTESTGKGQVVHQTININGVRDARDIRAASAEVAAQAARGVSRGRRNL